MKVTYLIDSENVGDFWIPLLELPAEEAELVVFYTRNSPHMSYDSLIRLKESDRLVTFIKCYEGTNALDFQLVSEMGYRIAMGDSDSYVIVTNDTGYDAAVKYWKHKKCSVKRITGKECRYIDRRTREREAEPEETAAAEAAVSRTVPAPEKAVTERVLPAVTEPEEDLPFTEPEEVIAEEPAAASEPEETVPEDDTVSAEQDGTVPEAEAETAEPEEAGEAEPAATETPAAPEEPEAAGEPAGDEPDAAVDYEEPDDPEEPREDLLSDRELLEVEMLVSCIGPDNLAEIHNQLAVLFGERGKEIYQGLKNGDIKVTPQKGETVEKYHVYGRLIFSRTDEEFPEDLPQFLMDSRAKMNNLNSLRYALLKHYGKDKGHKYYYILKPFVKVLNQM